MFYMSTKIVLVGVDVRLINPKTGARTGEQFQEEFLKLFPRGLDTSTKSPPRDLRLVPSPPQGT